VDPVLRIEGVTKFFGDLQVLYHLDVTIGQPELVGLMGLNGAGKSTLFNAFVLLMLNYIAQYGP
jgi:ABC-type multidrug transport system ATPase subunit